jgi:polysaccharide deacetylase family protein (PEP-CTERM system associated)
MSRDDLVSDWHTRQIAPANSPAHHAMTVDVEDYFQVEAFSSVIQRSDWGRHSHRVEENTDIILELFDSSKTTATFFTLGWVAERFPQLIRRIVAAGHELGSHGLAHHRADSQSRQAFIEDAKGARLLLEDTAGVSVKGYRAASFSITRTNLWAFEALYEAGYSYSSSTYPIRHDLYGIPDQPRFAFYPLADKPLLEIPVTTSRRFGSNWPSGGGGYFRLLPYRLFKANLDHAIRTDGHPCNFYFHPWEIDPGQPRIKGLGLKSRTRHYLNLGRTQARLNKLLRDFVWRRVDEVYPVAGSRAV